MQKILFLTPILIFFLSGCFGPKYIPARYFAEKHSMSVTVLSLPAVTHSAVENHRYESDPLEKVRKGLESAKHSLNQTKVFNQIDNTTIQKELEQDIKKRAEKIFHIDQSSRDLAVEVRITSWGWIVPSDGFLSALSAYQLFFNGTVEVFDLQAAKQLIAHSGFQSRENIADHLSLSETKRAIGKAAADAAELVGEFLWRSDYKDK